MKQTTIICRNIACIAVVTFFVACKKETISKLTEPNRSVSGMKVIKASGSVANRITSQGYVGSGTLGDSTHARK